MAESAPGPSELPRRPTSGERFWSWEDVRARLERLARRLLGSKDNRAEASSEDVSQQAIIKLLQAPEGLDRLNALQFPEAYLHTIVRNTIRDIARRKALAAKALERIAQEKQQQALSPASRKQLGELTEEVQQLNQEQLLLLYMRFWEGRSIGEIAAARHESYSAVAVRLFRLLQTLRRQLQP